MAKIIKKVENLCKSLDKTMFNKIGKNCEKPAVINSCVENRPFSQSFSNNMNVLFTAFPSLSLINVIHFSTMPTTTTTNNY